MKELTGSRRQWLRKIGELPPFVKMTYEESREKANLQRITRRKENIEDFRNKERERAKLLRLKNATKAKEIIIEKYCSDCGETKTVINFHKDKGSTTGFACRCKECSVSNQKEQRERRAKLNGEIKCKGCDKSRLQKYYSNKYNICVTCVNIEYTKLKEIYKKNKRKEIIIKNNLIKENFENGIKKCSKCSIEKKIERFTKSTRNKDGLYNQCKDCVKENNIRDKEKRKKYKENWLINNETYSSEYNKKNRSKINKRKRNRLKTDHLFKMKTNLRKRTSKAFKNWFWEKDGSTEKLLGCDYKTAFNHLQKQFTKGMKWSNHGEWHIDHIMPLASATTKEELEKLCHYTNLQPLWAVDNMRKGDKIPIELAQLNAFK